MQTFPLPKLPGFISLKLILAGLFLLFLIFFVLNNYLNIISWDKFSLKQRSGKLTINCPVPKEYCNLGKPLTYKGIKIGLGFSLPEGTPIKAVFPGTLENGIEKNEVLKIPIHPLRWLLGSGKFKDYTATYNFFASPVESKNPDETAKIFAQGDKIATSSADSFPQDSTFQGVNFIFSVSKGDKLGKQVEFEFK